SVFQSVSIFDMLCVDMNNKGKISVSVDISEIPSGEKNIAYISAEKFFKYCKCRELGADIRIWKGIPSQAGLGGGSADAAAVLKALNFLTGSNLTTEQLCEIGGEIGADVPFCIKGGTVLVEGIGDIMTPLPSIADMESEMYLCIAKGTDGISTAEAYMRYDRCEEVKHIETDEIVRKIQNNEFREAYTLLGNTFEQCTELKDIQIIKRSMLEHKANAAVMTGSGSAVYGIFGKAEEAEKCCKYLKEEGNYACVCSFKNCGSELL
ncbi:MAG: 4-(cytidine 5'-diphospho)-2-C-methyl-D-erythritol kinase, partial [Oscillospiraceae bacterium]